PERPSRSTALQFGIFLLCGSFWFPAAHAADPFADFVRKTDPLSPEQERASFRLPPGFEVQLVAAEPDIGKPMNMAFDARGRLWITQSREYPFPAPKDRKGREISNILEDTNRDGRDDKLTTCAEGLRMAFAL